MNIRHFVLPLVLALLLSPVALAQSRGYAGGAGGLTILCTGTGTDIAGACELACPGTCRVRVVDDLLEPQAFQVCDWDGAADVNCVDGVGEMTFTSATGTIDIFVTLGTTGTIYVD